MYMKKSVLRNYAKLLATVGIKVKKGQDVIINAGIDQPEFIKTLVEECYKAGAADVRVEWNYQPLAKVNAKYRSLETMSKVHDWELAKLEHQAKTLPARLHIVSDDPDGMKGIDQEKLAAASKARYPVTKPYSDRMKNRQQWCIAAVPGEAWARKVFPGLTKNQAVEKLWQAIIRTSRADNDPIAAWEEHNADLKKRYDYLNSLGIVSLEYKSSNGTDFRVGLMPESVFHGGGETTRSGDFFNPNIPSEEVFTTPKKGQADGVVYATMPLSYQGELIENFSITFKDGRACEVHAEKNEELLKKMINMDEGAAYLGECALVPYTSPINEMGILFYNTLFDENASCHLALGAGFCDAVRDYEKLTIEECREKGVNDSMIHVDFMIGSADLSIFANTADGRRIQIFKDGVWNF